MSDMQQDPQAQAFKDAWKKYGNYILIAIVIVLVAVYGTRFWKQQQFRSAAEASAIYDDYQQALFENNLEVMNASYNVLQSDYKKTPYASAVALIEGARAANAGALELAQQELNWVLEHGDDFAKPIARLRIAEILVQQQNYDQAMGYLSSINEDSPYKPAYDELKGDIFVLKGDVNQALELYRTALTDYREQGLDNVLLQFKLQTYAPTQGEAQ